jgi:hypothetical protein
MKEQAELTLERYEGNTTTDQENWKRRVHALDGTVHDLREHAEEEAHNHGAGHPHLIQAPIEFFRHHLVPN